MKSLHCVLALLLLSVGSSHAQVLNKCLSRSGAVSWQSAPCAQGMRRMRSLAYKPDAPAAVITAHPLAKVARKVRSARTSGHRVSARTARGKRDPCAMAKDRRDSRLERVGLKRDYALLSKLNAEVWQACR